MSKTKAAVQIVLEPITVDRDKAAALLDIALSTFEAHVSRGALPPPRQLGGCARWLVAELREAAAGLPVSTMLPVRRAAINTPEGTTS